jgi:hypothetical protein
MSLTYARIAADLAPRLDGLIDAYINGGCVLGGAQHRALERFLWDNKVGVLRVLQSAATPDWNAMTAAERGEQALREMAKAFARNRACSIINGVLAAILSVLIIVGIIQTGVHQ